MKNAYRVLVVDDQEINRTALKAYLTVTGFSFEVADDGMDALNKLKKSHFDLVFSDFEMPNMNGLQFLERVKKEAAYKDIPFVMLTTVDKPEIITRAKELGAAGYIVKPFTNQKMHAVMTALKFV